MNAHQRRIQRRKQARQPSTMVQALINAGIQPDPARPYAFEYLVDLALVTELDSIAKRRLEAIRLEREGILCTLREAKVDERPDVIFFKGNYHADLLAAIRVAEGFK